MNWYYILAKSEEFVVKKFFYLILISISLYASTQEALEAYKHGEYKKAFSLYMKEAKNGNVVAENALSFLYFEGVGVEQDNTQGLQWLQKAAQSGDTRACLDLGIIYLQGQKVTKNMQQAAHYLTIAANNGDPEAQYNLALIYYNGDGVKQDVKKAAALLENAAQQGYKKAQINVGRIYMQALDFEKAKFWLEKNVQEGDQQAKVLLEEIEATQAGKSNN